MAPGSTSSRASFPSSPAPCCATSASHPNKNSRIASWPQWTSSIESPSFTPGPGAIQSDAALRQSTEGRQMAAATLSVGVLLAILEAAPEIRVPFRVDSHHSSKLGGKSKGGRRDPTQPYRESPQRDCITLDRTLRGDGSLT